MILMKTGFVFSKDNHATYADLSADEYSTSAGYTHGGLTLTASVVEDDTDDRCSVSVANATWTAGADQIGPIAAACLRDVTGGDTIIGCLAFTGDQTAANGSLFTISNNIIRIT